jgi:hypothetical protein
VYLRRTPSPEDRLAAYPEGTQLRVVGPNVIRDGVTWRHVAVPDGADGYVPAEYTVPVGSPVVQRSTPAAAPAQVSGNSANDPAKTRALKDWVDQFNTGPTTHRRGTDTSSTYQ